MGKRFKKRFRNICCWSASSDDSKNEDAYGKQSQPKKRPNKLTDVESLRQEVDELGMALESLMVSLDAVEGKYKDMEREINAFFGESVVEKLSKEFVYTEPPIMVDPKMKICDAAVTSASPMCLKSLVVTDEPEEAADTCPVLTKNSIEATEKEVYQVQHLTYYCGRLFYQDATFDGDTQDRRKFVTELALRYNLVALQNVRRSFTVIDLEDHHLLSLRKMCYKLLAHGSAEKIGEDSSTSHDSDETFELSGRFGEINGLDHGLTRATYHLKEKNFLDKSGLAKAIKPLQSMHVILHNEILTTLNFAFRVTLRDIMLKNKFDEDHAKFLCINLLISLKHLHSLNIVQGHITPSNVMFTQFGYPCLTGFKKTDCDTFRPKARIEYSSPEQVKGESVTKATDVFQTGILVYSMIYGKSPFKADSYFETKTNLLNESFTPGFEPDPFTKDGRYFIRKLLRITPKDRFKLNKCRKPLNRAVKWFSQLPEHELFSQKYPSPFRGHLMKEIVAD